MSLTPIPTQYFFLNSAIQLLLDVCRRMPFTRDESCSRSGDAQKCLLGSGASKQEARRSVFQGLSYRRSFQYTVLRQASLARSQQLSPGNLQTGPLCRMLQR